MKVLIQGAGAVAAAAGALLADAGAEVSAASRREGVTLTAVRMPDGAPHHVRVVDYARLEPGTVDLLILTAAPGELAPDVVAALVAAKIPAVAVTSPVAGDAALTRITFPGAEVALLAPSLLSFATSRGTETRAEYWVPPLAKPFLVSPVDGSPDLPARLTSAFPKVIGRAPAKAVRASSAVMVPYAAELAVAGGDWPTFLHRLHRPAKASVEAMRADVGLPFLPPPAFVVRAALRQAGRTVPFDLPKFAGNHFVRHAEQSLRMLDGWRAAATRPTPALDSLRADLEAEYPATD